MTKKEIVELTIISDGNREYNSDEILNNEMLYKFVTDSIKDMPASILKQLKKENGNLIMVTDKNFSVFTFEIRNVSQELYILFRERYKQDFL